MNPELNFSAYARASPRSDALHRNPDVVLSEQGLVRASPGSDAPQWRPIAVSNEQGFSCGLGQTRVKKLVQNYRIRLASWNIGTLTGKCIELIQLMKDRRINIACLQETRWKGSKAKEVDGFKLWYVGKNNNRNGVGLILDRDLKDKVVEVKREGDRILLVKVVIGIEILNIISCYAPQIGLEEHIKKDFWENLDRIVQNIPSEEKIIMGGDFNGHVGKDNKSYERVHGGFGFGDRNLMGDSILDFAVAFDLIIANTYFEKRDEHLITYKSGMHKSQIDYFLIRKADRVFCKDCKVIPGESLAPQHRILVMDLSIRRGERKSARHNLTKIKWWKLKGEVREEFKKRLLKEKDIWVLGGSVNLIWHKMTTCIKHVAKELLGESKGNKFNVKETWWWSNEIKESIKKKRECFKAWQMSKDDRVLTEYKIAKQETKKLVSEAKSKAFEELYHKLGTREGEKDIFKLAKLRERKTRDLQHVRCVKDEDQRVLVNEVDIKERWHCYFHKLLNEGCSGEPFAHMVKEDTDVANLQYFRRFRMSEINEALRRIKTGKALGPDGIPSEVWVSLGDSGADWLTKFFNKILQEKRMPDEWRKSIVVPFYKNKGDIQSCNNYRGIKLMSHTLKLWERVMERRLRSATSVSVNQFGFMPGRSTTEAIYLLRQLMEKYREVKKDLYITFIDLEKAYDRIPRTLIWWTLEKKKVCSSYISLIKDMYEGATTCVRTIDGDTCDFSVNMGLHQGSTLSPYLFTLVLDEVTKHLHEEIPWCMLFADDIVLIDETIDGINYKVNCWREALESKGFKISRTKSEFMLCKFSNKSVKQEESVLIGGQTILKSDSFRYLSFIIQENGDIQEDVTHKLKVG